MKVSCVLCYCSEGDNMPESFQLAEAVCKLLGRGPENLHGKFLYHQSSCSLIVLDCTHKKITKSTMLKCFTPLNCSRSFNFCWNVAFYVWVLKGSFCVLTGNGSNGWTVPLSWKSVYGPPPDMSIF